MGQLLVGFDTETHLISAEEIVPRLVCATFDAAPAGLDQTDQWGSGLDGDAWIVPNSDPELVEQLAVMFQMAKERRSRIIIQAASFDLTVGLRFAHDVQVGKQIGKKSTGEKLYQLIWEVLEQGLADELAGGTSCIHDTIIREKLYNLSTSGAIDSYRGRELRYDLATLTLNHFGVDISGSKVSTDAAGRVFNDKGEDITGTEQAAASWRLRYSELDGVPLDHWPIEAATYAISDASWARKVFEHQERSRVPRGYGSMNSESLQVYADTALRLYSAPGFPVDRQQVARVNAAVDDVMRKVEVTLQLNGVVRPNNSVNTAVLKERIVAAWHQLCRTPMLTDTGEISAAGEVLETLDGIDPILDLYAERQELAKIRSAFLPALAGPRVWTNYDILKETGRISAYGSSEKAKKKPLYPAVNITQIPRKHGVRECFLAPEGDYLVTLGEGANDPPFEPPWVYVSCDYAALELCSVAQVTYSLFGYSVHRDKLNAGYDLHSYLGGAMARSLAPNVVDNHSNLDEAYKALRKYLKAPLPDDADKSDQAEFVRSMRTLAGMWRNFAKPTGLGYPGGLGPETHVSFAKATYGVIETVDQARQFRELWITVYPEMTDFFRWVNQQHDMQDPNSDLYAYETQGYNRMRAGTTYCATANGKSMQSLSADGAKRSTCWLARTCYGGVPKSDPWKLLHGCLPSAFIHDENLVSLPLDELATERCLMISQLMIDALAISMPDVKLGCEPAVMRRWTKRAEPEWVNDPGREGRVEQAITRWYGSVPPNDWLDEFFKILGPTYNPNRRLVPWDDVHDLQLDKAHA